MDISGKDAGKNARTIIKSFEERLRDARFIMRKDTVFWRQTNLKFDVLRFDLVPKSRSRKWRLPNGTFGLEPSCYFPFLPRPGAQRAADRELHSTDAFGQVRLHVSRRISQAQVSARNLWWAGLDEATTAQVADDVMQTITHAVLPFFDRFEEIDELLRTLLEDDDAIGHEGIWDFGKLESPKRLLLLGFTAIACGKWDLAIASLQDCQQKLEGIPEPVGTTVRTSMLPYVKEGLAAATEKRSWFN